MLMQAGNKADLLPGTGGRLQLPSRQLRSFSSPQAPLAYYKMSVVAPSSLGNKASSAHDQDLRVYLLD